MCGRHCGHHLAEFDAPLGGIFLIANIVSAAVVFSPFLNCIHWQSKCNAMQQDLGCCSKAKVPRHQDTGKKRQENLPLTEDDELSGAGAFCQQCKPCQQRVRHSEIILSQDMFIDRAVSLTSPPWIDYYVWQHYPDLPLPREKETWHAKSS